MIKKVLSKKCCLAVAAVAIAATATLSVALNNSSSLSGVNLANAKALAAAVATTSNGVLDGTTPCRSEAKGTDNYNDTYTRCLDCVTVHFSQGKGQHSECTPL
jgi:hypothetical protein